MAKGGDPEYGIFTDINSPVVATSNSSLLYPIVDPIGAISFGPTTAIPGFDLALNRVPGYDPAEPPGVLNNPAAMPVRWIYVLEDGTMVPGQSSGTAGHVQVTGASPTNRVVGRVAFWTDDETCKVNINTAADGSYFDNPRFNSRAIQTNALGPGQEVQRLADRQFAVAPPVAGEYQRYMGHPAQTRLSLVMGQLFNQDSLTRSQALTEVSPFLRWGGSKAGSQTIWDLISSTNGFTLDPPRRTTPYASLDEWIFSTNVVNGERVPNKLPDGTDLVTRDQLEKLRFFLTANSQAPEVNLFGHPRIAMWPIHNDYLSDDESPYTTALDRMIAKISALHADASSVGDTYFFTRKDAASPTIDYTGIPRNQELFQYLRKLADTEIPGFGGKFKTKYSLSGVDQILTEIFDYIRSANAVDPILLENDPALDKSFSNCGTNGTKAVVKEEKYNGGESYPLYGYTGRGQVTPIYISQFGTKGFGRFYSIREVAVNFAWEADVPELPTSPPSEKVTVKIIPAIYFDLFSPSLGPPALDPKLRIEIDSGDLEKLNITPDGGASVNLFSSPSYGGANKHTVYSSATHATRYHGGEWHPFYWGGAVGPRPLYTGKGSDGNARYGFLGRVIDVDVDVDVDVKDPMNQKKKPKKFAFSGGTLRIRIYWADQAGEGQPGNLNFLVQELTVDIPQSKDLLVSTKPTHPKVPPKYTNRLNRGSSGPGDDPINPVVNGDATCSVVSKFNGDHRLIAALHTVPSDAFVGHPSSSASRAATHSLYDPYPLMGFQGGTGFVATGTLSPGSTYGHVRPVVGLVDSPAQPSDSGDWDNGPSILPDGPYINKPDEAGTQYYDWGDITSREGKGNYAYYVQGNGDMLAAARGYSSPNRSIASPVMFGSLPTGVPTATSQAVPWRTLLFRPQRNHFGQNTEPKDYCLLDWFWMPVVEPYAISTHFATAGKVNMNYQIAPFTYITRATALAGTLISERVIAVPTGDGAKYKQREETNLTYRFPIKALEANDLTPGETTGTLRQFKEKFDTGKIFRAAAEICSIYLVPGKVDTSNPAKSWTSDAQAETFWQQHKLTGDNSRERPYNGLYSRLTTKSNTYTVYVRAQALAPGATRTADTWIESPGSILSEYRGSETLNRYIDPEDANVPDFAAPANFNMSLENYYKYRALESRRFLP